MGMVVVVLLQRRRRRLLFNPLPHNFRIFPKDNNDSVSSSCCTNFKKKEQRRNVQMPTVDTCEGSGQRRQQKENLANMRAETQKQEKEE